MRSSQQRLLASVLTLSCRSSGPLTGATGILLERHNPSTSTTCTTYTRGNRAQKINCINILCRKHMQSKYTCAGPTSRDTLSGITCRNSWRYYGTSVSRIRARKRFSWTTLRRQSVCLTASEEVYAVGSLTRWRRSSGAYILWNEGKCFLGSNDSAYSWRDNKASRIEPSRGRRNLPCCALRGGGIEGRSNIWYGNRHFTSSSRNSCGSLRSGLSSSGEHMISSSSSANDQSCSTTVLAEQLLCKPPGFKNSAEASRCVDDEEEALVSLGKLCAEKNLCSRREAEYFAALGLISVDGKPVTNAAPASSNPRRSETIWGGTLDRGNVVTTGGGCKKKFPVFFVRRTANVQLMPRAQRVMDSRLTVLLHKPLHYLSCQSKRAEEDCTGKLFCRQLLTAERRWEIESDDRNSFCSPDSHNSSGATKKSKRPPRLLNPAGFTKMGCAGRLDSDSSGLMVFTQDGRIASLLVGGGAVSVGKEYVVDVDLPISAAAWELLRSGSLTLDGRNLLPARVRLLPPHLTSVLCGAPTPSFDAHCGGPPPANVAHGTCVTLPRGTQGISEAAEYLQGRAETVCLGAGQGGREVFAADGANEQARDRERDHICVGCEGGSNGGEKLKSEPPAGSVEDCALWAGKTTRMAIELHEGRHRQIRRMCQLVGLRVLRLHRIRIGQVYLGNLPAGRWRLLLPSERFV